ncbi:MAG: alpha-ketoglutarate-dependent dioxygenase AlkB [Proteobacteria bacterium]|uniref:alpha-ketoglutarate-dependent dioxygenase AlkB family protein n=1 Tax=Rudaea sp. TaxID=2136325 RepID=UPI0037833EF4|nr:alpha-ketoglutarate-dependent dioxygenase AlkB [Pseudomonadota bacterium]
MTTGLDWRRFDLPGADVRLAQFCDDAQAARWFARLHEEIPWEQHRLRIFGREIDAPRLSRWIGDAEAVYTYSGSRFVPSAWTPALAELRAVVCAHGAECCNSVLANLYRDGRDSMGWHSDDEPELGSEPVIWSFSFGGVRRFRLRHRHDPRLRLELELAAGSLLRMAGTTQHHYRHDLPKTARTVAARINLTFRTIRALDG